MANQGKCLLLILFTANFVLSVDQKYEAFDEKVCETTSEFNDQIKQQIKVLSTDAQKIIDFVVNGDDKGVTYKELAKFVDKFGQRFSGTQTLEESIDYMNDLLKKEGHEKVHTEDVKIPTWIRGKEWAEMVAPRRKPMNIMSLGYSVGTDGKVLTGDVIVVKDFEELQQRSAEVKGKFVVYNYEFKNYAHGQAFRKYGASFAAKYGATAALVRSVTRFSIDSPHTGAMSYNDSSVPRIPAVAITVEDAELFHRMTTRGDNVKINLFLEATDGSNKTTRNTVSDITGSKYPDQVVIVSGHIDSWDVGQGAMDDGGGVFISWRVLSVLKKLGLQPKRTIRSIAWTAEETGVYGAKQYTEKHKDELTKISVAMGSDSGTFTPKGITFSGKNPTAQCILNEILKALKPINASKLSLGSQLEPDMAEMVAKDVPAIGLETDKEKYLHFHHTNGDTMTVENSHDLDLCTAVWTFTSYALASLDLMLPR